MLAMDGRLHMPPAFDQTPSSLSSPTLPSPSHQYQSPMPTSSSSRSRRPRQSAATPTAPIQDSIAGSNARDGPASPHRHMWIITGPAGCGKSTVAASLAQELQIPFIEGDDYHPAANVLKMQANIPLTDVDRWDWLITLRDAAVAALGASSSPSPHTGVVVACSALKRKYRDVIRVAAYEDHGVQVHFVYLHAPPDELLRRVTQRQGHFMGSQMVQSQVESLEVPGPEERGRDVLSCDVGSMSIADVQRHVLAKVRKVLAEDVAGYGSEEW